MSRKHFRSRPRRSTTLLVCALLALGSSACPKRKPAHETLEAMRRTTIEQGRVTREAMLALVAGYFVEVEARLRAQSRAGRAELREEIHRRAQEKADDIAAIAIAQLEAALAGSVAELDAALRDEQSKPAHARDRAKELELAVQLSSTLASLGRESGRLSRRASQRAERERDAALALVDAGIARALAAPELDLEPNALARELLAEFARASREYDAEMVTGLAALGRHADGRKVAEQGFAVGLFGEKFGERLTARSNALLARGEARLGAELESLRNQAMQRLDALP